MKQHFLRLFDYDHVANGLIVTALRDAPPTGNDRPQVLMAHLLASSYSWLLRCQGKSSLSVDLWPKPHWGEMESLKESNAQGWKAYLESTTDFEEKLTYQNQSGKTYTNVVGDLLAHVINHGTHHRAQIGQLLKEGGLAHLPVTDYIAYLRLKGL
ncbi:DinB family protein [Dinghuibacter silviterrae]|uniref:Putative damage-inducible protein DinB n=1 Tax=Dinghuibacter silviterrae TaxID=1539049 RepID=A0A4R8DTU5_9BACT|nr:DinB family protein [Dinghuibacter silviterrae]TDX01744.1 putative damage-inducible protein DinB [Dinghuibacter silviterrae]